jgi:hypothetical protein
MLVYLATFIEKVVSCSYIIPPSKGRSIDVCISYHLHRESCWMLVYHNAPIWKAVRCSCVIMFLLGRLFHAGIS